MSRIKKFHMSPVTGRAEPCQGVCKYGGKTIHGSSASDVRQKVELFNSLKYGNSFPNGNRRAKPSKTAKPKPEASKEPTEHEIRLEEASMHAPKWDGETDSPLSDGMLNTKSEEATQSFESAPVFRKFGRVEAVPVEEGFSYDTYLKDGTYETTKTADTNGYLVTNPDGEKYIVDKNKFESRYSKTAADGVYQAEGEIKAIQYTGEETKLEAPWSTPDDRKYMTVSTGDFLAAGIDEEDRPNFDRYRIGKDEFVNTYQPTF